MVPLRVLLIVLFGVSGGACLIMMRRVSQVPNADVRRGLAALLLLSGLWAVSEVGRLLFSSPAIKELMYIFGLAVGLPTVGAWLYFCSAYTGHDYHRRTAFRRLAIILYTLVVAVKFTNPYHGLYFTSTMASDPFPHLSVQLMPMHWAVTGLSYVLTGVGFYLLYELFSESSLNTKSLSALVLVTGLPAVLDILSYTGGVILSLNYEPVGVAVFSVGVLSVVDEQFTALPAFWRRDVLEALNDPVLVFGRNDTLRDTNTAALEHFPALDGTGTQPLETAYPTLAADLTEGCNLVETEADGRMRYYDVEREPLTLEAEQFGQVVILSDITEIERQRRELQRQNDQFDDFAEAITHELRNTLTIVQGHTDMMASKADVATERSSAESYERVTDAIGRMERIITDLAKLARYGQTLQDEEVCDLCDLVNRGWAAADTDGMSLSVETDSSIRGEESRLVDLFKNAFEFASAVNATTVSVSSRDGDLVITNDGGPLSTDELEGALSYGEAVPSAETGMLLPNVRTIGRVHGWDIETEASEALGISLRIKTG
jgi:signal transduction histidine kinase